MSAIANCQQCGQVPDDADQALIDEATRRASAVKPTGWICPVCRPPGFPADGLCYSVLEVGGESPEHEYEPEPDPFHAGDVVRHKESGRIGKVARFAHDGTTDFYDENGTGPYKQDEFEKLAAARRARSWDDE